jgi:hypothetical protein
MLVKQRDNEIGILLNYLNQQKQAQDRGDEFNQGVPVESSKLSTEAESTPKAEETKQSTLYQMMGGKPTNFNKSIAEKRMDFELNQQAA